MLNIFAKVDKSRKREKYENREGRVTRIGTWNIPGINVKEEDVVEEMIRNRLKILGITETKKKGRRMKRIHKR